MANSTAKNKRHKTTYSLPGDLKREMLGTVAKDKDYGMKAKSRWITDAINNLFDTDKSLTSVGVGDDITQNDDVDTINIPEGMREPIIQAISTLRRREPLWAGPQGALIRTAIRKRLENK